jgi:hypothetical protein
VSGKALLQVTLDNGRTIDLTLNVKMLAAAPNNSNLTLSSPVKSATVNTSCLTGAKIADVPIVMNVSNHAYSSWSVQKVGNISGFTGDIADAIQVTAARNKISVYVKDQSKLDLLRLNGKDTKYTLYIGTTSIRDVKLEVKTFAFTLTVTSKDASMTLAQSGKIDVANPNSAITVAARLSNIDSDIESVRLLDPATGAVSKDFRASGVSGKTFKIVVAHKYVVPGAAQKLRVELKLKGAADPIFREISVKPAQTVSRAVMSRNAVTLYRFAPLTGETVSLGLTTPANVKLYDVKIDPAAVKALEDGGFDIARNGANSWVIYFKDGKVPTVVDGRGNPVLGRNGKPVALKPSYTIKLELWAEGTYKLDGNGKPAALEAKNPQGKVVARSKPTIVNVRVNIR